MSKLFGAVTVCQGIRNLTTTAYGMQTNRRVNLLNWAIVVRFWHYVPVHQTPWDQYIQQLNQQIGRNCFATQTGQHVLGTVSWAIGPDYIIYGQHNFGDLMQLLKPYTFVCSRPSGQLDVLRMEFDEKYWLFRPATSKTSTELSSKFCTFDLDDM